jgi:hypothetical protein
MRAGTRRGGRCEEAGGGAAGRGQQNGDECLKTKAGRAGRQELVQAQHALAVRQGQGRRRRGPRRKERAAALAPPCT